MHHATKQSIHSKQLEGLFSISEFWHSINQYKDLRNVINALHIPFATKQQIEQSWCSYHYTQETNIPTTMEDAIKNYQNLSIERCSWTIWECYDNNDENEDCIIEQLEYKSWFAMKETLKEFAAEEGDEKDSRTYMVWKTIPIHTYRTWRIDTVWKWKECQFKEFIAYPNESFEYDWWNKKIIKQMKRHHTPLFQLTNGTKITQDLWTAIYPPDIFNVSSNDSSEGTEDDDISVYELYGHDSYYHNYDYSSIDENSEDEYTDTTEDDHPLDDVDNNN